MNRKLRKLAEVLPLPTVPTALRDPQRRALLHQQRAPPLCALREDGSLGLRILPVPV